MNDTIATLDPSDPLAREGQTFPRLNGDMAKRVAAFGTEEHLPKDTLLFSRGERDVDFFLVLEGWIEIFERDLHGERKRIRLQGAGEFTGEVNLFSERPSLVNARTGADSHIIRVKRS